MTFWEQRVTGHAHFAVLGNVEGFFLVILFFALQAIFGPHELASYKVIFGYSPTDLIIWLTVITSPLRRAQERVPTFARTDSYGA